MEITLLVLCTLILIILLLTIFRLKTGWNSNHLIQKIELLQSGLKEDFKINREENAGNARENRTELNSTLQDFKMETTVALKSITDQHRKAMEQVNKTLEDKITALINKTEETNRMNRETMLNGLKDFTLAQRLNYADLKKEQVDLTVKTSDQLEKITNKVEQKLAYLTEQAKKDNSLLRESIMSSFKGFEGAFDKNVKTFNDLLREKFGQLEETQVKLVTNTEKKLEEMRVTVDEKLQKTLNERLSQSFELVGKQLETVQKGLGEMQTLAQDVGGLKKVLSNVRMRGSFGEIQLSLLLEQILAPEQYESNVKTKSSSADLVEFAIKLPGKDDVNTIVWIPVDAKFPKDIYEQLQVAYETGDTIQAELAQKNFESAIKKMAKDIRDKYIDPPNTTDFAIMFLPFEGIYAEVVRKASLLEELQITYKVIVTGPTTLAAILNSLQMGFRTLVIQKRSSEVWNILGAVKKEFENFGGLLEKAQKNLHTATNQIDEVMGKRTRAIQRRLKGVEVVEERAAQLIMAESSRQEWKDEEDGQDNE